MTQTYKKYRNKESGEIVEISEGNIGIYMVNPVKILDKHPITNKTVECIECDDLIDENELKNQFEEIDNG